MFELRKRIAELPNDPVMSEKRHQLDHILLGCLGLRVESTSPVVEVVPGESLKVQHQVSSHSEVPIRWIGVRVAGSEVAQPGVDLKLGKVASADSTFMVPTSTPLTQPYWLMEAPTKGMFRVSEARRIGTPENPPAFPVEFEFEVGGQKLTVPDEVVGASSDGQLKRELLVISPVALKFSSGVAIFSPGIEKAMEVEIQSARSDVSGSVHLEVPTGWSVSPAELPFSIQRSGETTKVGFLVRAPASHSSGTVAAVANINGARFSNQRVEIRYSHIPFQLLQPPALVKVAAFDVATRGRHVGYLPGAGDDTAAALMQLGYQVTALTGEDLTAEKLGRLDAVVIGVRAFNERGDLAANLPALFSYVEAGGNVVVQYNRPDRLKAKTLGPYALSIEGSAPQQRVTDENAPVSFLQAEHPVLTTPNRIGPDDFDGWVQERGAYFPSSWDLEHYSTILAMSDPGEKPLTSSLLVARHGKGYFVYTGLAFFRQLPAGVPGAYRLFANLISLGK